MSAKHNTEDPRLTLPSLKVLGQFAADPTRQLSGTEIRQLTGLASGTLYPILLRFEKAGWLRGKWEEVNPSEAGRPRKRLYKLTGTGQRKAGEVLSSIGKEAVV